jgi:hypothetical protein
MQQYASACAREEHVVCMSCVSAAIVGLGIPPSFSTAIPRGDEPLVQIICWDCKRHTNTLRVAAASFAPAAVRHCRHKMTGDDGEQHTQSSVEDLFIAIDTDCDGCALLCCLWRGVGLCIGLSASTSRDCAPATPCYTNPQPRQASGCIRGLHLVSTPGTRAVQCICSQRRC